MKCIIVKKVRDKVTGIFYQPKKDKDGKDIPQEVDEKFYNRAKGTKYIKEIEVNDALENKTIKELKATAEEKGIELKDSMKKAEIIELLKKE